MVGTTAALDPGSSSVMDRLLWAVDDLAIELPSWGFVNTGTRFRVWQQAGVPRNVEEKVDDAGTVRRYTGVARSLALHIPWDKTDDYAALGDRIESQGMAIGGINSNTFQDADYMLGSLCHPSAEVRAKAVAAIVECCRIAAELDAPAVKVWLGDGTNYPGQDDLRHRRHRLVEGLQAIYAELPERARMLLEYKIFEPALYSTDVQDWGQALAVCRNLELPPDRTNPNGSGISLGHPLGATGARLVLTLMYQLRRSGKRYGIASACIGGGQGIAILIENPQAG